MLKLIKLEFRKGNIAKYIRIAVIMTLVLLLFLIMTAGSAGSDIASLGIHKRSIINTAVELYSNMAYTVFTGIMLAAFIVEEFERGTIRLMFSYPIKRQKIILSKILAVWIFNITALILSKLFIYTILSALSRLLNFSADDIPFNSFMFWVDMLLGSIVMISIAYIGLPIGLNSKSSKVTVVTAILVTFFSHIDINGYTLFGNMYYYTFLLILTVLFLFLSIYNLETKDV